jgi:hypothetical protein
MTERIDRENFPAHLKDAVTQWGNWNATFMDDDPILQADYADGAVWNGDYITDAIHLGDIVLLDWADDLADRDNEVLSTYTVGLNDELHQITLIYFRRGTKVTLLGIEADTNYSTVSTWEQIHDHDADEDVDQPTLDEPTDECPEHGTQPITGYSQTPGPDPYAINILACGHRVLCMGPGEPNTIV